MPRTLQAACVGPVPVVAQGRMDEVSSSAIRRVLSESPHRSIEDPSMIPAAVMLLLYPKGDDYCVLLNKRTQLVEHHKGEISFPGGRMDDEDASLLDTALRETHEEMGIDPDDVRVLGRVDDMPTNSNYLMSTFVGTIPYPYDFAPSEFEVAEILEAPISELTDPRSFTFEVRAFQGQPLECPEFNYRGHRVWGATGRVLNNFLRKLDKVPDEEASWRKSRR